MLDPTLATRVPFIVSELGADADPFMLHLYATLAEKERALICGAKSDILHWGISLQYSTYYLTSRFTPGRLPKDGPVNQFVPLVEFAFDMPREGKGTGTVNPGLAYVSEKWQFLAEAIIPLNSDTGHAIGFRAGVLLFLDDILPSVFGKPVFGR